MRRLVLFLVLLVSFCAARKDVNPLKTKKYKCVELAEDEEIRIVKKSGTTKATKNYSRERSSELTRTNIFKSKSSESMELPQARKFHGARPRTMPPVTTTTTPVPTLGPTPANYPTEVKRDSQGRPLILSPEHCQQVKKYAKMYGVTDVLTWVRSNCRMAQMFVPGATCEDINTLVESCYKNKFL